MPYAGQEKRNHPRISARFIVSYRVAKEESNIDVSQTKNISLGGMLLTTNKQFASGTNLAIEIRLPFDPHPIRLIAKVLDSREISKNLIYETRLQFLSVDEKHREVITKTVDYYLKKG